MRESTLKIEALIVAPKFLFRFKLTLVLTLRQQQQQMKEKTHYDFDKLWYKTKKIIQFGTNIYNLPFHFMNSNNFSD